MLKESIPTVSATTASWTVFRITWSPLIGSPAPSTVTGRNVSSPNSSVFIACFLLLELSSSGLTCPLTPRWFIGASAPSHVWCGCALFRYLSAQTSRFESLFLSLGERTAELRARRDAELAVHAAEIGLDRLRADEHPRGDALVRQPIGRELRDL